MYILYVRLNFLIDFSQILALNFFIDFHFSNLQEPNFLLKHFLENLKH